MFQSTGLVQVTDFLTVVGNLVVCVRVGSSDKTLERFCERFGGLVLGQ